jgi:hypothetical protein
MGLFDEIDAGEQKIIRAPFSYCGSKRASLKQILPHLPYRHSFIDVFGGLRS